MTLNFNLYIIDFIWMVLHYLKIVLLDHIIFSECVSSLQIQYAHK